MDLSINSSSSVTFDSCFSSKTNFYIILALFTAYILFLLPLFILVLYVAYERWRKRCSSTMVGMNSHSDIFTFNMVTLELIGTFGMFLCCCAAYCYLPNLLMVGFYIFAVISPGQTLFHLFTCVDRYLAVVYPITYLRLRQTGGARKRNISIVCVWLFCFASPCLMKIGRTGFYMFSDVLILTLASIVGTFCSISILCALIRPGPGEVGGTREKWNHSKQRAFHSTLAVTGALLSRFLTLLVYDCLRLSDVISDNIFCFAISATAWLFLPSSMLLPLLFLRRAGILKLPQKNNSMM